MKEITGTGVALLTPFKHDKSIDFVALENKLFYDALRKVNPEEYQGARVVVKGCSKVPVPAAAYVEITRILQPFVQSLMFGEPCSTVPLYKKKG